MQRNDGFRPRLLGLAVPELLGLLVLGGCAPGAGSDATTAMQRTFPERARAIVAAERAFVAASGGGFSALSRADWTGSRLSVASGASAADGVRIDDGHGFAITVRERGARGAIELAGSALSYSAERATAYWVAARHGVEEWLYVPTTPPLGVPLASYEVSGGELSAHGAAVYVAPAGEAPRLRVTAPVAYAADGSERALWLRVDGARIELYAEPGEGALLVDPAWTLTSQPLGAPRAHHAGSVLGSGDVLVSGGQSVLVVLDEGELYDPAADTWSAATGFMQTSRFLHQQTTLDDGSALVTGGFSDPGSGNFGVNASVDRYKVGVGFGPEGPMLEGRGGHTATKLADGRVLVAGGGTQSSGFYGVTNSAEIFDSVLGQWQPTSAMNTTRWRHGAVLLADDTVVVCGGTFTPPNGQMGRGGPPEMNMCEFFEPVQEKWTPIQSMIDYRVDFTLVRLQDGRLLAAGGSNSIQGVLASAEIYDPVTKQWSSAAPMKDARATHTATPLPDGTVLVAGGIDGGGLYLDTAEIYDPSADAWTYTVDPMNGARADHIAALLPGKVLVAGGTDDGTTSLDTSEYYALLGANGTPCSLPSTCASGFCVDGVCCDAICNGPCEACIMALNMFSPDGTCAPIYGGYDPDNECAQTTPDTCGTIGECNGFGACQLWYQGQPCSTEVCQGDTYIPDDRCDGSGACVDSGSENCGLYTCGDTSGEGTLGCLSYCQDHTDCAAGAYCLQPDCVPKKPNGAAAADPVECLSGFVADDVCCNAVCDLGICDACSVAAGATVDGTCIAVFGDCSDSNDCTADACDPVNGCFQTSLLDGTPCGGGACVAGACVPDPAVSTGGSSGVGGHGSAANGSGNDGSGATGVGPVRLEGGGCSAAAPGTPPARGPAPWLAALGLGLVAARRRRPG